MTFNFQDVQVDYTEIKRKTTISTDFENAVKKINSLKVFDSVYNAVVHSTSIAPKLPIHFLQRFKITHYISYV